MQEIATLNLPQEFLASLNGELRIGVNLSNAHWMQAAPDGELHGLGVVLGCEIARRLGCKPKFVRFATAGALFDARDQDRWDVAFMAFDPARKSYVAFTPPLFFIEGFFLAKSCSAPISLNRDETRVIGVGRGSAVDLFLSRLLSERALMRLDTFTAGVEPLKQRSIAALAAPRDALERIAPLSPGCEIMKPAFMSIGQACAVAHRLRAGAEAISQIVELLRAAPLVRNAMASSGLG